jgi:hypothetical protein
MYDKNENILVLSPRRGKLKKKIKPSLIKEDNPNLGQCHDWVKLYSHFEFVIDANIFWCCRNKYHTLLHQAG